MLIAPTSITGTNIKRCIPNEQGVIEMPYPRAKALRQVPCAIRQRLAERGLNLYGMRASSAA